MKKFPRFALLPALIGILSLGSAHAQGPVTTYKGQGILINFDPVANQATLQCNAIPGLMGAKTANLVVHDAADFNKMIPCDIVSFQLCVSGIMTWVEHASVVGRSPYSADYMLDPMKKEAAERKAAQPPLVVAPPRLTPGDPAPDAELTDQSGNKFHVSDFKGQALAITFIYTGCSMPSYCPMTSQNFSRTQDLMTRLGAGDRWRLLSISMDPARDTPAALFAYASAMHADPRHWTFATADESKVSAFGAPFGLEFQHTGNVITHNLCTVVIDQSGLIHSIYLGNSWTPQQLASDLCASMRHPGGTGAVLAGTR